MRDDFLLIAYARALCGFCLGIFTAASMLLGVNSRESKLIETAEKLVNLRVKYFKALYATEWAAGLLK